MRARCRGVSLPAEYAQFKVRGKRPRGCPQNAAGLGGRYGARGVDEEGFKRKQVIWRRRMN